MALGYTLVYGIIELINFAHGDNFMIGSFVGLTVLSGTIFGLELLRPYHERIRDVLEDRRRP